jgi:hypothetical protein
MLDILLAVKLIEGTFKSSHRERYRLAAPNVQFHFVALAICSNIFERSKVRHFSCSE